MLRGGSLRRTTLRRHVEVCPACAAFKAEVKRQRGAMAAILPVIPSLALKESVLAAVFGGGAAGGGGILGGGLLAAGGTKALVAKVATIAVVAGGATGGGLVAVDEISNDGGGNTATAMAGIPAEERSSRWSTRCAIARARPPACARPTTAEREARREPQGLPEQRVRRRGRGAAPHPPHQPQGRRKSGAPRAPPSRRPPRSPRPLRRRRRSGPRGRVVAEAEGREGQGQAERQGRR